MRVAVIDVGTNTALYLLADVTGDALEVVEEAQRVVRLGQGVDASRRLHPDAIARTVDAIAEFARCAREHGAERIVCAATSATRDAVNRKEFVAAVRETAGVDVQVLSGEQEAAMSLRGALSAAPSLHAATVVDVGGGSTEIITGTRTGVQRAVSVDVGSVRLAERWTPSLPPPPGTAARIEEAARAALRRAGVGPDWLVPPVVAVAGTATSVAGVLERLGAWDPRAVEGRVVSRSELAQLVADLEKLSAEQTLALAPMILRGRQDVFLAGVCVLGAALDVLGAQQMRVSTRGLRHGLALDAAHEAGD